jgi:DNA polymerase III alpha subunit
MKEDFTNQLIFSEEETNHLLMMGAKRIISEEQDINNDYVRSYSLPSNLADFDKNCQKKWFIPEEYKNIDVIDYVMDKCGCEAEKQRAAEELLLFQEHDLFPLLNYMIYFVETMRKNNLVWGLGRGSSVASFVLYLIGVHKVNSLYYDIPISEFFH